MSGVKQLTNNKKNGFVQTANQRKIILRFFVISFVISSDFFNILHFSRSLFVICYFIFPFTSPLKYKKVLFFLYWCDWINKRNSYQNQIYSYLFKFCYDIMYHIMQTKCMHIMVPILDGNSEYSCARKIDLGCLNCLRHLLIDRLQSSLVDKSEFFS